MQKLPLLEPAQRIAGKMASALGSTVRLPTRTPAFKSQQPRPMAQRPCLSNGLFGYNVSSVGSSAMARVQLPESRGTSGPRRAVVTMAAKGSTI